MRRLPSFPRRLPVFRLILVVCVLSLAAAPATTSAQYYDVQSNVPFDQLAGLQFAGQRLYQGGNELNIYIDVAVFDTADNAAAGLTALTTYYLDSYAIAGTPIAFEPADPPEVLPDAIAYHALLDTGGAPYADIALVQVQDGTTVLTAFVSNYAYDSNPEELAMEVAGAMLETIVATPVATATPATTDPASVMARLPLETGEVPAGFGMTYSEDTEWFVLETGALEETVAAEPNDPADLLYGDAEGLEEVIARSYEDMADPPENYLNGYVELAAFDSDDHAGTGYEIAEMALLAEIETTDLSISETDVDVSADNVHAWTGIIEDIDSTMVIIVTQSDNYVVAVIAYATDDEIANDLAEDLAQATIDADAGDGDVQFDDLGGSTGGLWNKLPAAGDDALHSMGPWSDEQIYP